MFKNVAHGVSTGEPARERQPWERHDDDSISLTSTPPPDSDEEYEVANVLAEQEVNGKTYFLIDWAGLPLDECTWEPATDLGPALKEMWEGTKIRQQTGEEQPIDMAAYNDAVAKKKADRAERHRRRNAKRRRLGLEPTSPISDDVTDNTPSTSDGNDGNEVDEELSERGAVNKVCAESRWHSSPKTRVSKMRNTRKPSQHKARTEKNDIDPPSLGRGVNGGDEGKLRVGLRNSARTNLPSGLGRRSERQSRPGSEDMASVPTTRPTILTAPSNARNNTIPEAAAVARGILPGRTIQSASRRVLTAKRSGSVISKSSTSNVFISGARPRVRKPLQDVMSDTTRDKKLFSKLRTQRLAEKRSRDKEDKAPDPLTVKLFEISRFPRSRVSCNGEPEAEENGQSPKDPSVRLELTSLSMDTASRLSTSKDDRPPKKGKSVRFQSYDELQVPELMDMDTSIQAQSTTSITEGHQNALQPQSTRTVEKCMRFGAAAEPISAIWSGVPLWSSQFWFQQFLDRDSLECSYSCFAKMFERQVAHIAGRPNKPVFWGSVKPKDNTAKIVLEAVGARLQAGMLGLYSDDPNYHIIVYPAKNQEWAAIAATLLGENPPSDEEILKYMVLPSSSDFTAFLRQGSQPRMGLEAPAQCEVQAFLAKEILGLDLTSIVPDRIAGDVSPEGFFLLFPRSREPLLRLVYGWIRARRPESCIFTSLHPGGWLAFRKTVAGNPGVVIVHELLTWSLHRIPLLHEYLRNNSDVYCCISELVHSRSIFPFPSMPDDLPPSEQLSVTRLFPDRAAILITPSFLVLEPQRASELFSWAKECWRTSGQIQLVSAWDLPAYLIQMAEQKARQRRKLLDLPLSESQREIQASLQGITTADCDDVVKAAMLALELDSLRGGRGNAFAFNEEASVLFYADPSIDPNDEQSLVNWFGWWSTLRLDQFREFYVIGSSQSAKLGGSRKGHCRIPIPQYTRLTINDPDLVMEVVQHKDGEGGQLAVKNPEFATRHTVQEKSQPSGALVPWSFQSRRVSREEWSAFGNELRAIERKGEVKHLWTLYTLPVSWTDSAMAQHFLDPREEFRTMKTWFNFAWPFVPESDKPGRRNFNTYLGFFYTITEEWDTNNPPPSKRPRRHPWIAVYRPVNPHIRPFKGCEVIIWDLSAKERFLHGQLPREEDLTYAQRYLIQLVRDLGPEKNPDTWLERAYLGGFEDLPDLSSTSPIDSTLHYLEHLIQDIRSSLRVTQSQMEEKGYKRIILTTDTEKNCPPAQPMDIDAVSAQDEEESDGEHARIIFHPPRGSNLPSGSRTKCTNRLYEAARLAKMQRRESDPNDDYMTFQFGYTLDWYEEQRAEGRGYEHVCVTPWQGIFNRFHITQMSSQPDTVAAWLPK
ncbi:hypothetical protein VTK73DRAFT_9390 [Phialemonium thermophilum]|uniref:Chromo domain-containing protein n=1 Tax=Phialemonium thermophilum TaxID=223376 RepID=A0ABR3W2L4_9PEZI